MPTLCNAPYLHQIHRLWVWAQGCSRLLDLLERSFRKHWFYHVLRSVGQILWNDHAKVCVQLRKSPPLWGCLACNVQVLGIPWSHLDKILRTKNESYMYLVIVPWADGLTNIDQSTKRVRGLVWENDTGICGRNVDTGQNTIIGHSHIMGPIIINYPKHLRSGVLDQEYCLPELSKWHHLLTLAARRGSLDACRLLDCVLHWALWLPHIPCAMGCFERLHLKPPHSFRACPRVCGKETHKQIASSNSELWLTRLIEQLPKSNIESDIYKNHETSCNMMLTITCDDDPFWLHILFHPGVTQWRITAASQIRACDLQRLSGFCWLFVHRCVVHTWVFTCPHHRIPCDKVIGLLFSFNIKDLSKTSEILEMVLVSCQSRVPAPRVFLRAKCLCLPQNHHIAAVIAPRMH